MEDRNDNNLVKKGLQSGGQRPENKGRMANFRVKSNSYRANAWPRSDHVSTIILCMRVGRSLKFHVELCQSFVPHNSLHGYPLWSIPYITTCVIKSQR